MKYVVKNKDGWFAGGLVDCYIDDTTEWRIRVRIFTSLESARRWIRTRVRKGWAEKGYWRVFRRVPKKPAFVEICGFINGSQWASEDSTYRNVVMPFLESHNGKRLKVRYEICS